MAERIPTELARKVKLVIVDIDGVLTDGGIIMGGIGGGDPIEFKRFEIQDGLGLKLMKWAGLQVYLVSGRRSSANEARARDLNIEYREADGGYKLRVVEQLVRTHNLEWSEVCCIGDDLPDIALMRRAGLPVAVGNAVPEVARLCIWQTERTGGHGAVRELAEALLQARGEWEALVEQYESKRSALPAAESSS